MIKNEDAIVDKKQRWNEDWPTVKENYYWHTRGHSKMVQEYLNGLVLDVGCGHGYLAAFVWPDEYNYHGIDISDEGIKHAKSLFPRATFHVLDAARDTYPYPDNHFDTVVCSETIEHIEDYSSLLAELKRVCKPRGHIVITVPISMGERDHVWPVWEVEDLLREFSDLGTIHEIRRNFAARSNLVLIQK